MSGLQKNVASQKYVVFAFLETDNTAVTGDAANITGKIAQDWGTRNAITDTNPTEQEDGYYVFDLTAAETNGNALNIYPESSTANVRVIGVPGTIFTETPNDVVMVNTTIATLASQTSFTLTAGSADNNAYIGCVIVIQDATTGIQKAHSMVTNYTGSSKTITLAKDPGIFTMATTDIVTILATATATAVWDRVLSGSTHNIVNSSGRRLRQIQELGSYGGFVWVDTVNGTAGTTNFENGVDTNPVDNIADANTIAASLGIKNFQILNGSSITLAANQDGDHFHGDGWTLALGGQSCSGSLFIGATVSGTCTGAIAPHFVRCFVGTVTVPPSKFGWCSLDSTITAGSAGDFFFHHCWSGVAGASTPSFDFGAALNASNLNMRSQSAGMEIENFGRGTGSYNITLEGWGQLILNSNVVPSANAVIELRGDFTTTDNVVGGYVAGDGVLNLLATFNRTSTSAYSDGVWIDTNGTNTNTVAYDDGTADMPVSTVAAAYTIASAVNVNVFRVLAGSNLVLPSDSSFKTFRGEKYDVDLNGQDIEGTSFHNAAAITGIGTGGTDPPAFFVCGIGTVTLPPCNGFQCGMFGTFTLGSAGDYTFGGSATVFDLPFVIDYGLLLNASEFFLPSWGGGAVEIQNAGAGTGTYKFEQSGWGDLTINANCSATTEVILRGAINVTNNATGITVDDDALTGKVETVGTPVALDGGTASIAGMLTKMSDDNAGADFDATTDSLQAIRDRGDAAWTAGGGVTIAPLSVTVDVGLVSDTHTSVFQHSGPTQTFVIIDSEENPVDVSTESFIFKVFEHDENTGDTIFTRASTDSQITVGGANNNQVSVVYSSTGTTLAGAFRYSLRNTEVEALVRARGNFTIVAIPSST